MTTPDVPNLVPRPDPTVLTLAALREGVERVEKQIVDQIEALRQIHINDLIAAKRLLEARLEGVGHELGRVEEVAAAQLQSITERLEMMEATRREMKADNTIAVNAALSAAKEFVLKQQDSTSEQLIALAANWQTGHTALSSMVDDVKTRIAAIEAIRLGGRETGSSFYAIGGVLLTIVWIAITVLALFHR